MPRTAYSKRALPLLVIATLSACRMRDGTF